MIKYKVTFEGEDYLVWLDAQTFNHCTPLMIEPHNIDFEEWLGSRGGAFGHLLDSATTPIDLFYAMTHQSECLVQLLENSFVNMRYTPEIPAGDLT